jgi:alpha-amylase/alpha-mannosidase (GH57 family)
VTRRISLALAIHNHQPVGNFGWVFEDVYQHAYRPMVEALGRHPEVVLSLHYTGPLLDWLQEAHPEFLADLRALTARGQVEMLGGGYYEPVLASLPERDRIGQLALMADEVERLFGTRPQIGRAHV